MRSVARSIPWMLAGTLVATLSATPPAAAAAPKNITRQVQKQVDVALPSLSPIVERVMAAVVNVSVQMGPAAAAPIADELGEGQVPDGSQGESLNQLLRRFFEQYGRAPNQGSSGGSADLMALGSGFIIDPSGFIVTNNHVIENAERITVILQDNSRHPAEIVGHDPKTDLALLKIDAPKPLPYVEWGDSDKAKVGDWVVAVGNPFGLGGTVTAGIVSARGRNIDEGPYDNFLQIDAPINRGNSGGPTFNLHGEVIGINTAIFSPSGGSVGIGFAIPSNFARKIVDEIKSTGHVKRGWLGVSIQSVTPPLAKAFGGNPEKPTGALIDSVEPGSPAAKAGLKRGDVILSANGKRIETAHDLPRIVAMAQLGSPLKLDIQRDGKNMSKTATIAAMPSAAELAALSGGGEGSSTPKLEVGPLGMRLAALSPDLRDELHLKKDVKGVVVAALLPGSPAASIGIKPGDVIESVNRQPVTDRADAEAKMKRALGSGTVVLFVDRGGNGEYVALNAS